MMPLRLTVDSRHHENVRPTPGSQPRFTLQFVKLGQAGTFSDGRLAYNFVADRAKRFGFPFKNRGAESLGVWKHEANREGKHVF